MKKLASVSLVVFVCICLVLCSVSIFPAEAEANETYKLKLDITFDSNMIFSRYNVKLKLDGKQIALMQHGNNYTGTQTIAAGNHVITFVKEDDDKITGRAEVYVEGETTFACTIHATRDEVEVSELKITSAPSGQKKTRTKPLDVIIFGRYEQDTHTENGAEPIEWYVLDEKDGKALLLSKKTIDNAQFNSTDVETTWESSSIRRWLNGSFISTAFTPEEQAVILTSTIDNLQAVKNGEWKKTEAPDTEDKVFLLSYNEYMKYLQLDEEVNPEVTKYANSRGSNWNIWLRSPGKNRKETQFFSLGKTDSNPVTDSNAVRPAMWIELPDKYTDPNKHIESWVEGYATARVTYKTTKGEKTVDVPNVPCQILYTDGNPSSGGEIRDTRETPGVIREWMLNNVGEKNLIDGTFGYELLANSGHREKTA